MGTTDGPIRGVSRPKLVEGAGGQTSEGADLEQTVRKLKDLGGQTSEGADLEQTVRKLKDLLAEAADALQNCWPIKGNGVWDPPAVWDLMSRISEALEEDDG